MTKDVVTFTEKTSIIDAIKTLTRRGISGAPVVDDDGRIVGVVTDYDITNLLKTETDELKKEDRLGGRLRTWDEVTRGGLDFLGFLSLDYLWQRREMRSMDEIFKLFKESEALKKATVKQVMTSKVVTMHPDEPFRKALELMSRHDINRIPIVDDENHVVGIVARSDMLKAIATQLGGGKAK